MPLLIDGHNLIARLPGLHLDDPDDEAQLVERLRRYQARTGKRLTVFFDAGLPGGPDRDLSTSKVRVVFASAGGSADTLIVRCVRRNRNPQGVIVVTSDEKIIAAVERHGARAVRSETFAAELEPLSASPASIAASNDVHLSPSEVNEWITLFDEPPPKPNA